MELEDEVLYGTDAPGRNIPELAIATLGLVNNLREPNDESELPGTSIVNHLDTYAVQNPLPPISFKDVCLEWFNVSEALSMEKDLNSHIVVLDFFTYCCINCLHILPDLEALEEKYLPNESPVLVVGIHSAKFENERLTKSVADAIKKYHILHPVANDIKCQMWHDLGISCWPTLLIVGPGGLPLFVLMGEGNKEYLFQFVEESLKYFEQKGISQPPERMLPLVPHLHLPSKQSDLYYPGKVETSPTGLIIADSGNNRILVTNFEGEVQNVVGSGKKGFEDGAFSSASFSNPQGVVFHPSGVIYVADTDNHAIRMITLETLSVETVAGTGFQGFDKDGGLLWKEQVLSSPWDVCLGRTLDVATDSPPNLLFIAMAGIHQIWAVFLSEGRWLKNSFYRKGSVVRLAGSGLEENRNTSYPLKAGFAQPSGLALGDSSGALTLFIADSESSAIRQLSCVDGAVRNVAGGGRDPLDLFAYGDQDGLSGVARFQHPLGITAFQDDLYVADSYNHKIKHLRKSGKVYTTETVLPAGNETDDICKLNEPGGLCVSEDGRLLFIADTNNFCIKEFNIAEKKTRQIRIRYPRSASIEPASDTIDSQEHLEVYLSSKKSEVNLMLRLDLPTHVHLTPDAKQRYSLECKENVSAVEHEGAMSYETPIHVKVDLSVEESAQLHIISKLFLCFDEGKCIMEQVETKIKFFRNAKEETQVEENLNFEVKIQPNL